LLKRGGSGVTASDIENRLPSQIPDISGDGGASGRGVFAKYTADLEGYMQALSDRLRRVRVVCGDWKRVLGPSPTTCIGVTGVFLDPPYAVDRSIVYNGEDFEISSEVRKWAIEHGEDRDLRIALCGYRGEHEMPAGWQVFEWKANGGYANQSSETIGRENAKKERVWFSPHCLGSKQRNLF
jgi:hypothetical protein